MQLLFDKTGFPLVKVDTINGFVHLLPITKIQYERFLSDPTVNLDSQGYYSVLELNPRISPARFNKDNAWKLLATAILPEEIDRIAGWYGADYRLPTQSEWLAIVDWLRGVELASFLGSVRERKGEINPLALTIIQKVAEAYSVKHVADICLFINVVLEWVRENNRLGRLALIGIADRRLFTSIEHNNYRSLLYPINIQKRITYAGFRFIKVP